MLIALSVPEVRLLLWWLAWGRRPPRLAEVIGWPRWRRRHQALAKACHYLTDNENAAAPVNLICNCRTKREPL